MYVFSPSGFEHASLDRGYSSLRSGDLESAISAQATVQHRGMYIYGVFSLII